MITFAQLEYIIALDTYRHFHTAADRCFVTQPTLSMQIKKLESDLGLLLFDRRKHPVTPTKAGEEIIEQARILLRQRDKIDNIVQEQKETIEGSIKIGIIPSLAPYLLPLFIGKLSQKNPLLKIEIYELITEEIEAQLLKDQIDIGILVTPLKNKKIEERPVFYEEILVYPNKNHPFAKRKSIKTTEISLPDIWLLNQGHCFSHQVLNLCQIKEDSSSLPFLYKSGSLETLKNLVDQEGSFTLLPALAINQETLKDRAIPFEDIIPLREVSLVYARSFSKTKILHTIQTEITQAVPREMLDKTRGVVVEWK